MAFNTSSSSGPSAEINVTPLIDVLLVLLIIFMVLVPVIPRGLAALLPQPSKHTLAVQPELPLVLQVESGPEGSVTYALNQQPVAGPALGQELIRVLAGRQEKVLFVRGGRDLEFSSVADVVALAHAAHADRIGILTPEAEAGR